MSRCGVAYPRVGMFSFSFLFGAASVHFDGAFVRGNLAAWSSTPMSGTFGVSFSSSFTIGGVTKVFPFF